MPETVIGPYVTQFEEFLAAKYKNALEKLAEEYPGEKSLDVDYRLLAAFDPGLADELLQKPYTIVKAAGDAIPQLAIVTEEGTVFAPNMRFFNLPPENQYSIRDLDSAIINRFISVEGVVTKITDVKPKIVEAVFECRHCGRIYRLKQEEGGKLNEPNICSCERKNFQLLEDQCTFIDTQRAEIQEPIEYLRGGEQAKKVAIWLQDDLTKQVVPGEKVRITGVLRLQSPKYRISIYDKFVDANHIERLEREFEEIELSDEDRRRIVELSKDPQIYRRIIASIAPSIYGHDEIKEAIALQLFGGTPNKKKADGMKIRSDLHILLIGDPGCLVADERVVLGNGAIVKIGDMGSRHLQPIRTQVLTGEGGKKRDMATRFHSYPPQPVIEVITESGKSIKGTLNHPLLAIENNSGRLVRKWRRLDEFQPGDRVAVVTSIPCTIQKHLETGFKPVKHSEKGGPRFHGKLPAVVDEDLASFMGYVLGDGWVQRYRLGFTVADGEADILPKLTAIAEKLFGAKPAVYKACRKGRTMLLHEACIHSLDVAQNLQFLRKKRVPDLILQSGNDVAAAFLRWLFEADGTVFNKGRGRRTVALKAKDIELLRDVQMLLLRFGVHSRIDANALMIRRGRSIIEFARHIGFVSGKKRSKLAELARDAESFQRLRGQRSERIVKIARHEAADVYDIEVPESHRFIANGIISHNTAKTQLLRYVKDLSPKGIYVSGKSSSAAGLTATAEKDELAEGAWVLKAGALVLAAGGMAMIDEFDKMSDEDRSSMHEAMESQVISVAKAGMITTFRANTAILAAANPKYGRFDRFSPPAEQFEIPPTIISRFDLIFPVLDVLDPARDSEMADHILSSHYAAGMRLSKDADVKVIEEAERRTMPAIPPELLRKYIAFARKEMHPTLTKEAMERIKGFYVELRRIGEKQASVPITARYLEAVVRLAEASAKGRLSATVDVDDADRATRLLKYCLGAVGKDPETGYLDIDIISTGQSKSKSDRIRSIERIIKRLNAESKEASHEAILEAVKNEGLKPDDLDEILQMLKRDGYIYSPRVGFYKPAEEK